MQVDAEAIFADPRVMFYGVDGGFAHFAQMTRESYARSIFFDRRLQPASPQMMKIPLEPLLAHIADLEKATPNIRFIHHFAHSGSTLLSRALDHPDNLGVREPLHLRQLGAHVGATARGELGDKNGLMLSLSLAMLGKRFAPNSSVIVKGNVPITLLAEAIAEAGPDQAAILLYLPLEDYCAAVLRTPRHRQWVEMVTAEIRLSDDPVVGDIASLSTAEKAAALWFSMIKRYERMLEHHRAMRSLDSNVFFERPAEVVAAANELLEAGLSAMDIDQVTSGPLFTTYSKNPNLAYDNDARVEQLKQTKAKLGDELKLARNWVEGRLEEHAIPATLSSPLIGDERALL